MSNAAGFEMEGGTLKTNTDGTKSAHKTFVRSLGIERERRMEKGLFAMVIEKSQAHCPLRVGGETGALRPFCWDWQGGVDHRLEKRSG